MNSPSQTAQSLLDQGIQSTRVGRFGEAGQHFLQALEIIEALPDGQERSCQLEFTANLISSAGHPDLALMALRELLESQERSSNPGRHCADLLTLANIWCRLGRPAASAAVNEAALVHALTHRRFAEAASASTNLAMYDANGGRHPEALTRLQESLKLLAKASNPDTEAITRLVLLQVVDAMQVDPEIALEPSMDLFTRLERYVGQGRWNSFAPAFHRLVDRYLVAHPELDAEAWKRKTFPLVFGGEQT